MSQLTNSELEVWGGSSDPIKMVELGSRTKPNLPSAMCSVFKETDEMVFCSHKQDLV